MMLKQYSYVGFITIKRSIIWAICLLGVMSLIGMPVLAYPDYDPEVQYQLGVSLQSSNPNTSKSAEQAFQLFSQAAGKNSLHPGAQLELARAYFTGEGTDRNLIAAYIWSSVSAGQMSAFHETASRLRAQVSLLLNEQQIKMADQIVQRIK